MHRSLLSEVRFTLKYGELARGQIKVSRRRLRLSGRKAQSDVV
jgi:hypothetical protein